MATLHRCWRLRAESVLPQVSLCWLQTSGSDGSAPASIRSRFQAAMSARVSASHQRGTVRGRHRLAPVWGIQRCGRGPSVWTSRMQIPAISETRKPQEADRRNTIRFCRVLTDRRFRFRSTITAAISERHRIRVLSNGPSEVLILDHFAKWRGCFPRRNDGQSECSGAGHTRRVSHGWESACVFASRPTWRPSRLAVSP